MKQRYDVVIVGGGPAAVITAVTARASYPDKSVALIRKLPKVPIPCGIPYIIYQLGGDVEKDILPDAPLDKAGVEKIINEVVEIDRSSKAVILKDGKAIEYDRLVIATGSIPVVPPIEGVDLTGVFTVDKDPESLKVLVEWVKKAESILIVGAGFIGMEVADELIKLGKNVYLVEMAPWVLPGAFDEDFAALAKEELEKQGVKIYTGKKVERISGSGKVEKVVLSDGTEFKVDMVILATGYKPNSELAKKANLELNCYGAINVDEFMRTSDVDIFAVGDVASKTCFLTRKASNVMLASTAVSEARIAGINLFSLKVLKAFFWGTIAIFSTVVGDSAFASAGVTEQKVKDERLDFVVGRFETVDKHPGSLPGAHKIKVKLLVSASSGVVLGAQIYGGNSVGELINLVGLAIQNKMRADELMTSQIGTHPRLTSAPTVYPVIKAAEDALKKVG